MELGIGEVLIDYVLCFEAICILALVGLEEETLHFRMQLNQMRSRQLTTP